ncbi:MAG: glycosyltransferase, partial [Candidatus Micrarchaeia archaeon]
IEAFKQLEFRTVPKIEYIFTNSRNSQDRIKKFLKRDSEILYPGVDASRFSSRPAERYFFYPSRIAPEKELEFAIEAFKLFSKREAGWKLVIAGGLSRRPEHQAYLKRIRSLCTPEISIETNISEERLLDLYSRCSSVLYTPVNEDFGIVPLEAMASGKPCIARNEGGPRETVIDGTDGYLVGSVWEMSEKMSLISKNPDKAERMGKAGRTKVGRDFTWDRFLKRFSEKTAEIVDSAGSAKKQ